MKKVIGLIIFSGVFIPVILAAVTAYGWQTTLEGVVISFVIVGFMFLGTYLIVD